MNEFIYDLTSYEKAINSLSKLVGVSGLDIEIFIYKNAYDYDSLLEKFIHKFNIDIEAINISNLYLKIIQVTTNGDNCESIKKYGLLNTQEAIKKDTYFSKYLMSKGIKINFDEESISYNEEIYYRSNENNSKVKLCFTKLFSKSHYPINAFIYSDNPLNYGGEIKRRPELIGDLADSFGSKLEKDWVKNTKCFLVVFKVNINELNYSVFIDHKGKFEEDKDNVIKEWLINKSLDLLHDLKLRGNHSDVYAYMNSEYKIPLKNIIEFMEVNNR